jgi:hypothetical protein
MNLLTFYDWWTTLRIFPLIFAQIIIRNILQPEKIPFRFKAYVWLIKHFNLVIRKRKEIKSIKKIMDKYLLKKITWKLFPRASKEFK